MGGGTISGMSNASVIYEDTYVAGEIGDLTTPVNDKNDSITAFAKLPENATSNSYYDKQTTGMREDGEEKSGGITGILTQDKKNAGVTYSGLTSQPGTNGFKGFSDNSQWVFENGLYPQLAVFANADKTTWGDATDMVKAYSKASVQTVYLENYETDYNDNELPLNTYDTVRDITSKFTMSNGAWKKGYNTDGTFTDKTTTVNGKEYEILTMDTMKGEQWVTDFAPGIEWLQVKSNINTSTGSRILRMCPTINLDPGNGSTVIANNKYDHRDNVTLAYTSASNLGNSNLLFEGNYNEATNNSNILNVSAAGGIDNVAGNFGNKIHTLVYDFDANNIYPDASFTLDELKNKLQNSNEVTVAGDFDKIYTGENNIPNTEKGYHLLEYIWELPDGRYVRNGKMVVVKDVPFDVSVHAVKDLSLAASGANQDDTSVKLGTAIGNSADLSNTTISQSKVEVNYGNTATISWEIPVNSDGNPISELTGATIRTGTDYTEWCVGSYDNNQNQFKAMSHDFSIIKNTTTDTYDVLTQTINRTYPIIKKGNTYQVTFNFNDSAYKDIEDNVEVNLQFERIKTYMYTVKYDTQGGNTIADKTGVKYGDNNLLPITPVKDGYIFHGWKLDDKDVTNDSLYSSLAENEAIMEITLVAQWEENNYSVKYDTGFDDVIVADKENVKWNDTNLLPEPPKKDGYGFIGWELNDKPVAASDKYSGLTTDQTDGSSITLVAKWVELTDYSVLYNTKGGSMQDGTPSTITGMKYADMVPTPAPIREGYTFEGWTYQDTSVKDGSSYNSLAKDDTIKQIELVAQWEISNYTIDYEFTSTKNPDGISVPTGVTVEYGGTTDEPKFTAPANWTFSSWYTDKECTQKFDFNTAITGNMTLYGKWTYKELTIPPMPSEPTTPDKPVTPSDLNTNTPQTGDTTNIMLYAGMLLVAGLSGLGLLVGKKRESLKDNQN